MEPLTRDQVLAATFSDAPPPVQALLERLDALSATVPAKKRRTPDDVSDAMLDLVAELLALDVPLVPALLFALTAPRRPLLGGIYRRFSPTGDDARRLLTQFVEAGSDDRYPCLNLSRQDLDHVPAEVGEVDVPSVDVGGRPYKELDLGYNRITTLSPADYARLAAFPGLHLVSLKMDALGEEVALWTDLVMLNVSWSDLKTLPEALYGLPGVRALKLNWTAIPDFSPAISQLALLAFVEVSETPFLHTVYRLWEGHTPETDHERAVAATLERLEALDCEIDESASPALARSARGPSPRPPLSRDGASARRRGRSR